MSNRSAILTNPSLKDLLDNNLIEIANYLMTCSTFLFYAVTSSSSSELSNCIKIIADINEKTSFTNKPEAIKKVSKIEEIFKLQEDRSKSNPDNISKEDFNSVVTFIQGKLKDLNALIQQLEKSEELTNNNYASCKNHLKNLAESLESIIAIKQQAHSGDELSVLESDSDEDYFDVTNSGDEAYFDVTNSGYESSTSEVEFDTTGFPDVPDSCRREWPSRSLTLFNRRKPNTVKEEINVENNLPLPLPS